MTRPGLLVDVEDLDGLGAVLLDTRLAQTGPPGRERYAAGHLPGAAYVDLDTELAAPPASPPRPGGRHPLPEPARFVASMRRAGVRRDSTVVVYDDGPATAAARLWWLLRDHGHTDVMVLDGGLAAWTATGRAVSRDAVTPTPGDWTGSPGHLPTITAHEVPAAARDGVLLDVRAAERFRGEHEPLDPVAGHIPGAVNAPLAGNTDARGRFLSPDALRDRFALLGVDDDGPVAAYCGSGVTATQTVLAVALAGLHAGDPVALYPGSWSDWISDPSRPVATGPSRPREPDLG